MSLRSQPKRREDLFFVCIVCAILVVNFIGFARSYYLAGIFRAPLAGPLVHVHGALFTCWLLLLATQTVLIGANKAGLHRTLGVVGVLIAAGMLILGPLVTVFALRRHAFPTEGRAAFIFVADSGALLLFALFAVMGFLKRQDVLRHKRLMLLATIAILGPALSRWSFPFMNWPPAVFLIWLVFPIALIVYDISSRRKPAAVSVTGCALLLLYLFSVGPISDSHAVRNLVRSIERR